MKLPEQGPEAEQKPKPPVLPVPDVAPAQASPLSSSPSRNIPLNESPVFPYDPPAFAPSEDYVYSPTPSEPTPSHAPKQLLPPTPTHELTPAEEVLFEKQTAQEMRRHPLVEQRLIMQEQDFNVELNYARSKAQQEHLEYLRREEETARSQFQTDILRVKAQAWSDWQSQGGRGVSQDVWNVEWGKWEAGESARFEGAVSAWKVGEQFAFERQLEGWTFEKVQGFSSYKQDVLKTLPVPKQRVVPAGYVPYSETFFHEPTVQEYEAWESRAAHRATFGALKRVPFTLEQLSAYEKAEARAVHGASFGLLRHDPVFGVDYNMRDVAAWIKSQKESLAFQSVPQASKSDVTWKIDVKVAHPVPFGSLFSEEYLTPAVFGKDYSMKDLARFAKTLTPSPVFGVDYNMRDVGAWAKKQGPSRFGVDYDMRDVAAWAKQQKTPAFGVDYTMKDVGRWAKSFGESPEGQAYIAADKEQAAYEAKQMASREFYTKIGYPQYGGKYEPFDTSMFPAGYDLNISETAEGLRIEPNIPQSITQRVSESRGGLFSNWLSGATGLSKQLGYQNVQDMVTVGQANLKPYFAEFIAPFESAGVSLAKFAGVQGLQDVPSTALSSFLGSIKYGKAPLGVVERGLFSGNARVLREAELLKGAMKPDTLFLSPSPELLGYAVRPDLMLSSLLGEAALFYGETKAIQGVGKLAHGVYNYTIKGSGLEQRLVNWAWKDPGLAGFEKAGIEKIPSMDTSYLKSSSFITGYEQNTGLMSSIRGMIRGRLPLSELTVGLPTLSGYVPSAAEEALVKGSVGLGGYDMKWLPRLQAGLEFGDMMASPGAAGFGLTVPAPVASIGLGGAGRVYAFELMSMPAGFASGFARSTADKWADVGFIDDSSKYDMSMSKGGRFFKETMPSDYLAGFARNEYPLLEIGRGSLGVREFAGSSEYGFTKSGKSLSDLGLVSLSRETFMPMVETMRLSYLPLSESQLAGRAFLKLGSLPALSLTFGKTAVKSWNVPSVSLSASYMTQRPNMLSKQRQQQYMDETQFLSYPGVDVGIQQTMKPTERFKESSMLFGLQQSRFITDWRQKQEQKPMLGLLGSYSFKPSLETASLLRLPSARESLPRLQQMDYGLQSTKSSFLFGLSGFAAGLGTSTRSTELLQTEMAQTQKLYAGQRQLQLKVHKTLLLSLPVPEKMLAPESPFDDVGYYKKPKKRKTRMMKEYPFGKFLRVTPVMTAREYRKMMLG